MVSVHGLTVAGATFPVPIWHEYMAAALWHHKVLGFMLPDKYPIYRSITRGNYGSLGYVYTAPTSYPTSTPTTTAAVTTQQGPAPPASTKPKPATPVHTTTAALPPPPPPLPTTTSAPPPTTTSAPPGGPGQQP
jgi:membrane carboxypeptidase/penicillin-binding protein